MRLGTAILVVMMAGMSGAHAAPATTLAGFNGTNGENPETDLIVDAAGDLFGTTSGVRSNGAVFEIAKTAAGYGTLNTLASFNGATSNAGVIADAAGNLFGTTFGDGANGSGAVSELVNISRGSYMLTTPASFENADGANPNAGLTADAAGNLFGATLYGGANSTELA